MMVSIPANRAPSLADFADRLKSRAVKRPRALRTPAPALPALFLMTDDQRLPDPEAAIRALPAGAGVVFRHYRDPQRERRGAALRALCRARRLVFLVAGDGRLAARLGADGLHLPEGMSGGLRGWRRRRPGWLITIAAHSAPALRRAAGADAAFVSPAFATESHRGAPCLGPLRLAALIRQSPVPAIALGGISARSARRLNGIRLAGVAAISGLARKAEKLKP